jgi:hypothetical protein
MNLNIGRSRGERGMGVRVLRPRCHPWALPILKHKVNIIMNMNIGRSQGEGGWAFLHLLLKNARQPMPTELYLLLQVKVHIRSLPSLRNRCDTRLFFSRRESPVDIRSPRPPPFLRGSWVLEILRINKPPIRHQRTSNSSFFFFFFLGNIFRIEEPSIPFLSKWKGLERTGGSHKVPKRFRHQGYLAGASVFWEPWLHSGMGGSHVSKK